MTIDEWIQALSGLKCENSFNPWSHQCGLDRTEPAAIGRRNRLRAHLSVRDPRILCIGEAPGWRGCRFSGCGFTSERLIFDGAVPRMEEWAGQRITTRPAPFNEASATIVWRLAYKHGFADQLLLWNAFPLHPYGESQFNNRTPTRAELNAGKDLLAALIGFWPGIRTVAIGKKSYATLQSVGFKDVDAVRHPSMGGARKFERGMHALLLPG